MTATPTGPALQDMVAPGQEDMIDSFLAELQEQEGQLGDSESQAEEQPGEQLLAGKFRSTEELEKAYQELQSKLGQRGQQPQAEEPASPTPEQYTPELGKQLYGDTVGSAIEAAAINPLEMAQKAQAGEDVSSYVDALVEKGGLPRELVDTYLQGVKPQQPPAADGQPAVLSDVDVAELKAAVGGDQEFARISQWAVANLSKADLADYNAAVDSGNKAAARFALTAMKALAGAGTPREPQLIGGGSPVSGDVFETSRQAIDALNKRGENGRRLYESDPKYRAWYDKTMARSNPFG